MVTQYFRITDPETQREEVAQAAAILREGGLLGIPTETVYGLGANGRSEILPEYRWEPSPQ